MLFRSDPRVHSVGALNEIIEGELTEFVKSVKVSMEQLSNAYTLDDPSALPIILIGGGSKLKGLKAFLSEHIDNEDIQLLKIKTIGARDPSLVNLLGAIIVDNKFPIAKNDVQQNRVNVSREE